MSSSLDLQNLPINDQLRTLIQQHVNRPDQFILPDRIVERLNFTPTDPYNTNHLENETSVTIQVVTALAVAAISLALLWTTGVVISAIIPPMIFYLTCAATALFGINIICKTIMEYQNTLMALPKNIYLAGKNSVSQIVSTTVGITNKTQTKIRFIFAKLMQENILPIFYMVAAYINSLVCTIAIYSVVVLTATLALYILARKI